MASVAKAIGVKPGGQQALIKLQAIKERAWLERQQLGVHPACRNCPHGEIVTFVPPDQYERLKDDPSVLPMKEVPLRDGTRALACVLPPPPWGGAPRILRLRRPTAVQVVVCCEADCPVYQALQARYKPPEQRGGDVESVSNPCEHCTFYNRCSRQLQMGYVD